jgi:rhamnose transport system ATP-binding protein
MPPLLAASAVAKSYGGVRALRHVDFELHAGEIHALVGENGAGKSTLIRIFAGAAQPDSGQLRFEGQPVALHDPLAAKALGIAVIYQQPALFGELTVAENIGLSLETGGLWRRIDWKQRRRLAQQLLAQLGSTIDPERPAAALTMPEQQTVEIAKSLGARARVLILDEPTASLSEREVNALFGLLRDLRRRGVGMIYVSHRLEELPEIATRVTVLRDGETVQTRAMAALDRPTLIRMMVGRDLDAVFPKRVVPAGSIVLETRALTCPAAGVNNVSITVRAGEIVGLSGLVGAGRTELAEVLFGLHRPSAGAILLRGKTVNIPSPQHAVRLGIAYVPEDRRRHGLIMPMSVAQNIALAQLAAAPGLQTLDEQAERRNADRYRNRLAIKTASVAAPVHTLSGGNQQKVCLARWLAAAPALLILDEPTQGVDIGAKAEIHQLMSDLAAGGMAILMISSELPEILGMSDRIYVMRSGAVAGELSRAEATQERLLTLALGEAGDAA